MDFSVTLPAAPGPSEPSNDSSATFDSGAANDGSVQQGDTSMEGVEEGAAGYDGEGTQNPMDKLAFVE